MNLNVCNKPTRAYCSTKSHLRLSINISYRVRLPEARRRCSLWLSLDAEPIPFERQVVVESGEGIYRKQNIRNTAKANKMNAVFPFRGLRLLTRTHALWSTVVVFFSFIVLHSFFAHLFNCFWYESMNWFCRLIEAKHLHFETVLRHPVSRVYTIIYEFPIDNSQLHTRWIE